MATFPDRKDYCLYCAGSMRKAKPQARYCSRKCKLANDHRLLTRKHRLQRLKNGKNLPGKLVICKHPFCQQPFIKIKSQLFCSKYCAANYNWKKRSPNGFGDRCAVYIKHCKDCGNLVTRRSRGGIALCPDCRRNRHRAINARRNHKRRAAGYASMNINDLALRDGQRCHLCHRKIDLSLSGRATWGPTIDHILPVSLGGTNDPSNLALAHRCCNVRRGNREPAQMLLSA